jgi:hypothetical protein
MIEEKPSANMSFHQTPKAFEESEYAEYDWYCLKGEPLEVEDWTGKYTVAPVISAVTRKLGIIDRLHGPNGCRGLFFAAIEATPDPCVRPEDN